METPKAINHLFVGKSGAIARMPKKPTMAESVSSDYPQATLVHHFLQGIKHQKPKSPNHRTTKCGTSKLANTTGRNNDKSVTGSSDSNPTCPKTNDNKLNGNIHTAETDYPKNLENAPSTHSSIVNHSNSIDKKENFPKNCDDSNNNNSNTVESLTKDNIIQSSTTNLVNSEADDRHVPIVTDPDSISTTSTCGDDDILKEVESYFNEEKCKSTDNDQSRPSLGKRKKKVSFSESEDIIEPESDQSPSDSSDEDQNYGKIKHSSAKSTSQSADKSSSDSGVSVQHDSADDVTNGLSSLDLNGTTKVRSDTLDSESSTFSNADFSPSRRSSDSPSHPVFSPESNSQRCFHYSYKRSLSERSSSQSSQDSVLSNQAISEHLGAYSRSKSALATNISPSKDTKSFSPFPVKHFNENRAKTGVKLGMYKADTLTQINKQQAKRKILWSK